MDYKGEWESKDVGTDYGRVLVLFEPVTEGDIGGLLILDADAGSKLLGTANDVSIYFSFKGFKHVGVFNGRPVGDTIRGSLDVGKGTDKKSYSIILRRKKEREEIDLEAYSR